MFVGYVKAAKQSQAQQLQLVVDVEAQVSNKWDRVHSSSNSNVVIVMAKEQWLEILAWHAEVEELFQVLLKNKSIYQKELILEWILEFQRKVIIVLTDPQVTWWYKLKWNLIHILREMGLILTLIYTSL